jgi:hypothetical protein
MLPLIHVLPVDYTQFGDEHLLRISPKREILTQFRTKSKNPDTKLLSFRSHRQTQSLLTLAGGL